MVQSGDWIIPTLAGEPFLEKPPLYFLTAAVFAKLLGGLLPLHDAVRIASAFYNGLTLCFVGLTGRELWGPGSGRVTVLLLIGSLGLVPVGHALITDTALLAGFAIAFYGLLLARRRWGLAGVLIGMGTGIGFMSKGLLAPGIIGLSALALPALSPDWRSKAYVRCLAVAFVVALPWMLLWPYLLYLRSPELAWQWLWEQNLGRFFGYAHLGPSQRKWFYFKTLPWFACPTLPLAAWALWRERKAGLRRPEIVFPLAIFLAAFLTLSAASDSRSLYALPLLLPLAYLAALGVAHLSRRLAHACNWIGIIVFSALAAGLWFFWGAMISGYPGQFAERMLQLSPEYDPSFLPVHFFVRRRGDLRPGSGLLIRKPAGQPERSDFLPSIGLRALPWCGRSPWTICLPWIDAGKSYKPMIMSLQQALPEKILVCCQPQSWRTANAPCSSITWGCSTQRVEVSPDADCDLLLEQGGVPQSEHPPGPEWKVIWEGARRGDGKEHFLAILASSLILVRTPGLGCRKTRRSPGLLAVWGRRSRWTDLVAEGRAQNPGDAIEYFALFVRF